MFFEREETSTIATVEERIAQWVMMDKNQGEGLQVLFYQVSAALLQQLGAQGLLTALLHHPCTPVPHHHARSLKTNLIF